MPSEQENDYSSRQGQDKSQVPVVKDDAKVEDPIDENTADSDEQLAKDDKDAIDESNILDERTRGAAKKEGSYAEPGDEEVCPYSTMNNRWDFYANATTGT